jgi:hypothetical protein
LKPVASWGAPAQMDVACRAWEEIAALDVGEGVVEAGIPRSRSR